MRILVPIHAFDPGGVERVGLRLAERWAAKGHDVTILLGRDRGLCRAERPSLDYHCFTEWLPTEKWETLWMSICLVRWLWRDETHVIFCPGLTYTAPCVVARVLLGRRCPAIVTKISNDLKRPEFKGPFRLCYLLWLSVQAYFLTHFVAIAAPMASASARLLKVSLDRISTIPDPALSHHDLVTLSRIDRADQRFKQHFLAVGRLVAQKDFALLLDAFASCAEPGDHLTIAGEGPERKSLERKANSLGIRSQVSLPGHVADTAKLYNVASVLVISSHFEGMPAVVPEALAAGLPIAATDCCDSMRWLLNDGRFGALAAVGDSASLASAMQTASAQNRRCKAMRTFAERFTLERADDEYLRVFESVIRRSLKPKKDLPSR